MCEIFKSELLSGIQKLINSEGGTVLPVGRAGNEVLRVSYFPELKHGLLAYDADAQSWDELSGDTDNLAVLVFEDGRMIIETGDDGYELYSTVIKSVGDFKEAIKLFENAAPEA